MLSIVFCGRNDNHNGDFEKRAVLAQQHNRTLLKQYGIDTEVIYVEWNPLPDREVFGRRLRTIIPDLTVYVVPPELHIHVCDNRDVNVLQFFAKNAGARRATGDHLLITNADTYLTADVLDRVSSKGVDCRTLYIYRRIDVDTALLDGAEITSGQLQDPESQVNVHEVDPPRCYGAAGDLMLLKRTFFEELGGFTEAIRFSSIHVDTLFCRQVEYQGADVLVDGVVYHVDHADSFSHESGRAEGNHNGSLFRWNRMVLPYRNREHWGMLEATEEEHDGYVCLTMSPEKRRTKQPESPVIPPQFMTDAHFQNRFDAALRLLKTLECRVLLYGFGAELRAAATIGELDSLNMVGCLDDRAREIPGLNMPVYGWDCVDSLEFDAVLVGSAWWAHELIAKAVARWGTGRVLPALSGSFLDAHQMLERQKTRLMGEHVLSTWDTLLLPYPKLALFGAGKHTDWLLRLLHQRQMPMPVAVLEDAPRGKDLRGVPVLKAPDTDISSVDAVVLSSDTAPERMADRCRELWGDTKPYINVYAGFSGEPFEKEAVL